MNGLTVDIPHLNVEVMVTLAAVIVVTAIARLIVARVVESYARRNPHIPSVSLIVTVAKAVVVTVGLLVALSSLGIAIAPVLTALGVGGLAVALALRDTLANLFAGLQILASRQIRPGDFIKFEGGEGCVEDVSWRNTAIRDLGGSLIVVPNEKLSQTTITRWGGPDGFAFAIPFNVPRQTDLAALAVAVNAGAEAAGAGHASLRSTGSNDLSIYCALRVTLDGTGDPFAVRDAVLASVGTYLRASV